MKRSIIILLAIIMILFTACSKNEENKEVAPKSDKKVGVLLHENIPYVRDVLESLVSSSKEFGVDYEVISLKDINDESEKSIIDKRYDTIVSIDYEGSEVVKRMKDIYPEQKFTVIDRVIKGDNVNSMIFPLNEGAYLLGVMAGNMTNGSIGFVGGKEISLIKHQEEGFIQGVKAINGDAKVDVAYLQGFNDINGAYDQVKKMRASGTAVLFTRLYDASLGAYTYARESIDSGNAIFLLGDSVGEEAYGGKFKGINVCDFEKDFRIPAAKVMELVSKGDNETNRVFSFGIFERGIKISDSYLKNINPKVVQGYEEHLNKIFKGEIVIGE